MNSFTSKEASARALEARLREVSKHARNFYDQPVRQLRTRLRDAYADVLLDDPVSAQVRSWLETHAKRHVPAQARKSCAAARRKCQASRSGLQAHEIETALWKWVFYKRIEEFRHRVRYAADAGEKGEEPLRKVWRHVVAPPRKNSYNKLISYNCHAQT